jgi:DNA polymerase-3 subunit alpha
VAISQSQLRVFINIGALAFTGKDKKQLRWKARLFYGKDKSTNPVPELFPRTLARHTLPELEYEPYEEYLETLESLGFPLESPFDYLKTRFRGEVSAAELINKVGKVVKLVGYYVTVKPTTTLQGERMYFGCFIDAHGVFFDTVHFPSIVNKYPFKGRGCYLILGEVTEDFGTASINVQKMALLPWVFSKGKPVHKLRSKSMGRKSVK